MTKRSMKICAVALAALLLTACSTPASEPVSEESGVPLTAILTELNTEQQDVPSGEVMGVNTRLPAKNETRAIWFSYEDLSGALQGSNKTAFRNKIESMFFNCADAGINTVIVHVRPFSDSFYPSEYFPWSKYVTGTLGKNPGYDPLEVMVAAAKEAELKIEAWINPMRGLTMAEASAVSTDYAIRKWYDDPELAVKNLILYNDRVYYNPASEDVRNLISSGVAEIIQKYDVDGIHIDDYFYPSGLAYSYDAASYNSYISGGGTLSQDEWRRENVSLMVSSIYRTIKDIDSEVIFGVSPQGNPNASYNNLWADVESWVQQFGYLDYIAPQLYYSPNHSTAPFEAMAKLWSDLITKDHIELRLGMAAYKVGAYDTYAGNAKYEWMTDHNILATELNIARGIDKCSGVIFFRYSSLFNPGSDVQAAVDLETQNLFALMK